MQTITTMSIEAAKAKIFAANPKAYWVTYSVRTGRLNVYDANGSVITTIRPTDVK